MVELQADPHTPRGRMAIRDAALLSVMPDGLLRRGEAAALRWDDLTIEDDGSGKLTVQCSKTDQTGEGAVLWISPQTIEATERWRKVAGTGSSMFDLSARSLGRVVTWRAEAVGLQASGHSLRVGMAQEPGRFRRRPARVVPGWTVAIPHNGYPLHPFPGGRSGRGGPLLPPLLKPWKRLVIGIYRAIFSEGERVLRLRIFRCGRPGLREGVGPFFD